MNRLEQSRIALAALDLTLLEPGNDPAPIDALCARAVTRHGPVAALCIQPWFVARVRETLDGIGASAVQVATVANFPDGNAPLAAVINEVEAALDDGADEIDVVLPWRQVLAGESIDDFMEGCRIAARTATLKVILETGQINDPDRIREAALAALDGGADFIKTSTGMAPVNATPEAVAVMLDVLQNRDDHRGIKIAGGIATVDDAVGYVSQVAGILGPDSLDPDRFRLGASRLLNGLLAELDNAP